MIVELVYTSVACRPFDIEALDALLADARERNRIARVTGILLYRDRSFLQLLEGSDVAVQETYERIRRDKRHEAIRSIRSGAKVKRSFASWSMGFVSLGRSALPLRQGPHALSSNGTLLEDDDADTVAILDRFRNGEWAGHIR